MKILVVCQYYYPEPFRINDICEELVKRGHEVTVLTAEPNYPEGKIYSGYEKHNRMEESINGVNVHRCSIIPRKRGIIYRFLNYYSFVFSASRCITSNAFSEKYGEFDVIFVYQLSPVMMAIPAIKFKEKYNVPILMYCLDLWPESLMAGGVKKTSLIYRWFYRVSKKIYRKMDKILITSQHFSEYFDEKLDIDKETLVYLPQYAEEIFKVGNTRTNDDVVDLVFAGNIGTAQSVETILNAAELLIDRKVYFHIVGSGTELDRLKKKAQKAKLDNLTFYGRRPIEEMPMFYENASAMLVTLQSDPVLNYTLPGKVQSYMAAGKPIIGAVDGETADVIKNAACGFCGPAEDAAKLAMNILRFSESKEKMQMGKNARKYYEENFAKSRCIDLLESELKNCIEK